MQTKLCISLATTKMMIRPTTLLWSSSGSVKTLAGFVALKQEIISKVQCISTLCITPPRQMCLVQQSDSEALLEAKPIWLPQRSCKPSKVFSWMSKARTYWSLHLLSSTTTPMQVPLTKQDKKLEFKSEAFQGKQHMWFNLTPRISLGNRLLKLFRSYLKIRGVSRKYNRILISIKVSVSLQAVCKDWTEQLSQEDS